MRSGVGEYVLICSTGVFWGVLFIEVRWFFFVGFVGVVVIYICFVLSRDSWFGNGGKCGKIRNSNYRT